MSTYGYYRLASVIPPVRVADVDYNVEALITSMKDAVEEGAQLVVFPELCITGASCADLFCNPVLLNAALEGLARFAEETAELAVPAVVSLPLLLENKVFNMAAVVKDGWVMGLVPKSTLPGKRECAESRVFSPAAALCATEVNIIGQEAIPVGTDLIFTDGDDLRFAVEMADDLCAPLAPGCRLALQGALLTATPAAAMQYVGVADYRRSQVVAHSGSRMAAILYASAGVGESTQDGVYGGQGLIAVNGSLLVENPGFEREGNTLLADVDMQRLQAARLTEGTFAQTPLPQGTPAARMINIGEIAGECDLAYADLPAQPFVPTEEEFESRCEEILSIQAAALAKRMEHAHAQTLVLGVSGGLDSTLALLVCDRACKLLGRSNDCILALTMPGFGTTGRTYNNAVKLIKLLGCTFKEVNIKEACLLHFKDLDFDPALRTNTYENVQARERTKILMNLANKTGGMVVGTGDLSEIALGWATYNGDHMSMYSVNCSVPKSLIRCLIEYAATQSKAELAAVLRDVNATPVSPELLPPADDGSIEQKTEEVLGPYDLHDFFLYHFIKYGAEPSKLLVLALQAFADEYDAELIEKTLRTFLRRFFTQQFKRTCVPDGPKVGSIALSPRADWRMPTDVCGGLWQLP